MYSLTRNCSTRHVHSGPFNKAILSKVPISAIFIFLQPLMAVLCLRERGRDEFAQVDLLAIVQIAYMCLAGLWLISRLRDLRNRIPSLIQTRPIVFLVAYLTLAGMSTIWSTYPSLTIYRFIEASIYLGLIVHCTMITKDIDYTLLLLVIYCAVSTGCKIAAGFRSGMMLGDISIYNILHANVGAGAAAAGMFLSLYFIKSRYGRIIFTLLAVMVIAMTCTTAYLAVLVSAMLIIIFRGTTRLHAIAFMVLGVAVIVGIYIGSETLLSKTVLYGKTPEAIETGTGRLAMWEFYLENSIDEKLWYGQGYEAGEHQLRASGDYYSNAHNAFIAAFVNLGVPGLLLTLLLAVSMVFYSSRLKGPLGSVLLAATLCLWICSLTMPSVSSMVRPSWITITWICVLIACIRNGLLLKSWTDRHQPI